MSGHHFFGLYTTCLAITCILGYPSFTKSSHFYLAPHRLLAITSLPVGTGTKFSLLLTIRSGLKACRIPCLLHPYSPTTWRRSTASWSPVGPVGWWSFCRSAPPFLLVWPDKSNCALLLAFFTGPAVMMSRSRADKGQKYRLLKIHQNWTFIIKKYVAQLKARARLNLIGKL